MALSRARRRHGRRGIRSSITGAVLPPIRSRELTFTDIADETVDYLRDVWPEELRTVRFAWADMPPAVIAPHIDAVPQWRVDHALDEIVIYRLPIQRMLKLHLEDEYHRRIAIEGILFRAAGEYLGREPWEIAPDRYGHR